MAAPWSVRSRVHEYGGGEFLAAGDAVYFVNDADQDVYLLIPGSEPQRLTREPALRFADFALDDRRGRLLAIAERHTGDHSPPENLIVAIALAGPARGQVSPLLRGRDFFAAPRLSPDGGKLAYVAWDLPDMPWDQSQLLLADLDTAGDISGPPMRVAGGDGEAAGYPTFTADGALLFVTDARDLGSIACFRDGRVRAVESLDGDYGRPLWTLGAQPYALLGGGRIVASSVATGRGRPVATATLVDIDPKSMTARQYAGMAQIDGLTPTVMGCVGIVSPADGGAMIAEFRIAEGQAPQRVTIRKSSEAADQFAAVASLPRPVSFPEAAGQTVHAFYFAPKGASVDGPAGQRPPALVLAHGGPTSMASRSLSPRIQFYTSRGFAVLDVDYAGSTGYGRQYRERLDGQWGVADVADCAAGARFLADSGFADPARIAIAGGSAGGYTTLMALATTDVFAAGSSHYGISDLALLMEHTHKFESGYLHRLLGTTPEAWRDVCRTRSPIHLVDRITAPLILFQGLEDRVVPPEQSRVISEKLKSNGRTVELHEFAGEGHGFRRAETIVAVLEAELAFLQRALVSRFANTDRFAATDFGICKP